MERVSEGAMERGDLRSGLSLQDLRMAHRSRTIRAVKCGSLVLALIVAAVWAGSMRWSLRFWWEDKEPLPLVQRRSMVIRGGRVFYWSLPEWATTPGPGMAVDTHDWVTPPRDPFVLIRWHELPLWVLLVALGAPAGVLFWRDRRRYPAHCCQACGYELTGNTSGVCPECGNRMAARTPLPPSAP